MATIYSASVYNGSTGKAARAIKASAPHRGATDNIAVPSGTAINDQIIMAKVMSNAILLPSSILINTALGASVTMDIGFLEKSANELATGLAMNTAGQKSVLAGVSTANTGKAAWELAGYSADPKGELTIVATIKGAATSSAGNIFQQIEWVNGT